MAESGSERPLLFLRDQATLSCDPEVAWDLIKVFDKIDGWHPATENCVMLVGANGVPNAVREFQLKGGGFVISELLEYDEQARWYRYRILKTSLPMKGYVGEMHVERNRDGGCTVVWTARFQRPEPDPKPGEDDAATVALVTNVFSTGLESVAALTSR